MPTENQSPLAVLQTRAAQLSSETGGLVAADVRGAAVPDGESYIANFYLVGPQIGYNYALFSVEFAPELYPARIKFGGWPETTRQIANEEALRQTVEEILAHPKTRRVIEAIEEQSA